MTPRLLVPIDKVRAYKGLTTDTIGDTDLTDLVERVSDKMMDAAGREFIVDGAATATRVFDVTQPVVRDRELELGDCKGTITAVTIKNREGVVSEVANAGAYTLLPRHRESWQPIAAIRFELYPSDIAAYLLRGYTVSVAADWGFPLVPPRIVHEAIKTTYAWLAKDVQAYSKLFNEKNAQFAPSIGQHELPLSAQQACERFRVPVLAGDDD